MSSTGSEDPLDNIVVLFENVIKNLPSLLELPVLNERLNTLSL